MSRYLYGASIHGIQDFIFATNKLKEIVGASEIVKSIEKIFQDTYCADEILINTAGNIKAVFNDRKECEKAVLEFRKLVSQKAYGITLSQAVVSFNGQPEDYILELENKLKVQRNKPMIPLDSSINFMGLNAQTGKPAINKDQDVSTQQKLQENDNFYLKNPSQKVFKEISDLKNAKGKVAIIHIDGNGLGTIVKSLGKKLSSFSNNLTQATNTAYENSREDHMDIRKVIIGGDDVTIICNANNALEFTQNFLRNFEEQTRNIPEINTHLTACAGIAFCNEKFPFYYAVDLAETLCSIAKNDSNREASALMFHNIQSSNYQEWNKFVRDELTIKNDKQTIRCDFGPYYLDTKGKASISAFINTLEAYRCDNSPISRLRNWLNELYRSDDNAKNLLHRVNTITKQSDNWNCEIMNKNLQYFNKDLSNDTLIISKDGYFKTPIYDILQILSVTEAK